MLGKNRSFIRLHPPYPAVWNVTAMIPRPQTYTKYIPRFVEREKMATRVSPLYRVLEAAPMYEKRRRLPSSRHAQVLASQCI